MASGVSEERLMAGGREAPVPPGQLQRDHRVEPAVEAVEGRDGGELALQGPLTDRRLDAGQDPDPTLTSRARQPQPRDSLADIGYRQGAPVAAPEPEPGEQVGKVVGVGLDRVR